MSERQFVTPVGFFFKSKRETYRRLRGFIMKHQRVHIAPVPIRAKFCVRDSFSGGRLKSEMPAMTRAHCRKLRLVTIVSRNGNTVNVKKT